MHAGGLSGWNGDHPEQPISFDGNLGVGALTLSPTSKKNASGNPTTEERAVLISTIVGYF